MPKSKVLKKGEKELHNNLEDQIDNLLKEASKKLQKGPVAVNSAGKGRGNKVGKSVHQEDALPAGSRNTSRRTPVKSFTKSRANRIKAHQNIRGKTKQSVKSEINDKKAITSKANLSSSRNNQKKKENVKGKKRETGRQNKKAKYESEDDDDYEEKEDEVSESENESENDSERDEDYDNATLTDDESDYDSESDSMSNDNDYSPKKGTIQRKMKKPKRKNGGKKSKGSKAKNSKITMKREKIPHVSEMVIDSIKALGANPKKGSNLRSIKETILLNWPINMKMYNSKIKKFINTALEKGDIIRVKGNGFNGRFTIPGLKMKKKKKKSKKLGKKYDEDEEEYAPKWTKRDDEREETKASIENEREKRKVLEEKLLEEKASRPKKKVVKREEWEVEAIKGIKDKNDEKYYLVKWKGYSKLSWEPEENIQSCHDLIEEYLDTTNKKEEEIEKWKRLAEKGIFEPERILDVKIAKGKRLFLIRWKGHGKRDDKWELESNLKCRLMIERFMLRHDQELQRTNDTRVIREAPKRLNRFVYASSKRVAKRNGGLGVSYAGMDEE